MAYKEAQKHFLELWYLADFFQKKNEQENMICTFFTELNMVYTPQAECEKKYFVAIKLIPNGLMIAFSSAHAGMRSKKKLESSYYSVEIGNMVAVMIMSK
jgi:hypothetical protein